MITSKKRDNLSIFSPELDLSGIGKMWLGIDIGNGGLKVILAIEKNGTHYFYILSFNGHLLIPSLISFEEKDSYLIGIEAENSALLGNGIISLIGKNGLKNTEITYAASESACFTSNETLLLFLQEIKKRIENLLKISIQDIPCFFSYPANFDSNERRTLNEIMNQAGFNIVGMQEEPTAAMLSFMADLQNRGNVLVIDLGAGTSDNYIQTS